MINTLTTAVTLKLRTGGSDIIYVADKELASNKEKENVGRPPTTTRANHHPQ